MKYFIPLLIILTGIGVLLDFNIPDPAKKEDNMLEILKRTNFNESDWILLNNSDQIRQIISDSKKNPVLIFKHSTSCGISHLAQSELKKNWDQIKDKVTLYYLDLLAYRSVSNEIARIFNVVHQSPQLILVVDGNVISSWSHYEVNVQSVLKEL